MIIVKCTNTAKLINKNAWSLMKYLKSRNLCFSPSFWLFGIDFECSLKNFLLVLFNFTFCSFETNHWVLMSIIFYMYVSFICSFKKLTWLPEEFLSLQLCFLLSFCIFLVITSMSMISRYGFLGSVILLSVSASFVKGASFLLLLFLLFYFIYMWEYSCFAVLPSAA